MSTLGNFSELFLWLGKCYSRKYYVTPSLMKKKLYARIFMRDVFKYQPEIFVANFLPLLFGQRYLRASVDPPLRKIDSITKISTLPEKYSKKEKKKRKIDKVNVLEYHLLISNITAHI